MYDFSPSQARDNLIMVMDALGLEPNFKNFETMGEKLSSAVGHTPPWSAKYVHSVYKGYKGAQASPAFGKAILTLGQLIDNAPPGVAGARFVKLLVFGDDITEGVLVPRNAQVSTCARPGCNVVFIKVHPFQRYHDKECQKEWAKEKKRIDRVSLREIIDLYPQG